MLDPSLEELQKNHCCRSPLSREHHLSAVQLQAEFQISRTKGASAEAEDEGGSGLECRRQVVTQKENATLMLVVTGDDANNRQGAISKLMKAHSSCVRIPKVEFSLNFFFF